MSHQVNFYLTPPDLALLERAVRAVAPVQVLHYRSRAAQPRRLDSVEHTEDGHRWLSFYLVRPKDVDHVLMRHVPAQHYWSIDDLRSPVIEFNASFFDERILRRGRLYYVDGFFGEDDQWVAKAESFRDWAKAVFKATKKTLRRKDGFEYIGPDALAWLKASGGALVE